MMYCSLCEIEIDETVDYRNVNGRIVCDSCFEDHYHYCSRCDAIIHDNDTYWDEYGDPFCEDCRHDDDDEETFDDDSPNNPEVSEKEINDVIELANQWLNDDNPRRYNISIRTGDYLLAELRKDIGLITNPVYVFGLYDREDYQLSASPDLYEQVNRFVKQNYLSWKVNKSIGTKRLGVGYSIRKNEYDKVTELIKDLTEVKVCVV